MNQTTMRLAIVGSGRALVCAVAILLIAGVAFADVTLPKVIGNSMVLQQGKPINLWGRADPGERVAPCRDNCS